MDKLEFYTLKHGTKKAKKASREGPLLFHASGWVTGRAFAYGMGYGGGANFLRQKSNVVVLTLSCSDLVYILILYLYNFYRLIG